MALAAPAACLALVLALFVITVAFGSRVLDLASLKADLPLDHLLFSSGIGFAALQLFLGLVAWSIGLTVQSVTALLVAMAIASWHAWKSVLPLAEACRRDFIRLFASGAAKALGIGMAFFLSLEFLLSTAPLTGSDAMHYHFTAPLLEIGKPERPIFWLTHSFFLGLAHQLIALGLVLGGDRLALLLIFFGGCLTACALLQLARRLMPVEWALAAVLTFLMTPMVFWQIGTAGSPDIWMGFFAAMAVLAVEQIPNPSNCHWWIAASVYAGAGAAIKYTGWVLPAGMIVCLLWFTRSIFCAALGSAAALATGVLPLVRNFVWTGDPFFPFLNRWIGTVAANPYGLAALQSDVRSHAFSPQPLRALEFLLLMVLRGSDYGVGHYFGPVILAFSPLLFFCNWKARLTQVAGALWLFILLANAFTTQMARFLLPAYPLALLLIFAGVFAASRRRIAIVRFGVAATLAVYGLFCLGSDSLYAKDFLPVSLGLESKEAFLNRMAPDYQAAEFVNSSLQQRKGKVLIYFRHAYYVRVPYENGNPAESWSVNPAVLIDPPSLLAFLKAQDIAWVVKSPQYPEPLAGVFEECEREGLLVPEAKAETESLTGNSRVYNIRKTVPVVLMRVTK